MDYGVARLGQIFSVLSKEHPETYSKIRTAGMLCVRRIKDNPTRYSNLAGAPRKISISGLVWFP